MALSLRQLSVVAIVLSPGDFCAVVDAPRGTQEGLGKVGGEAAVSGKFTAVERADSSDADEGMVPEDC